MGQKIVEIHCDFNAFFVDKGFGRKLESCVEKRYHVERLDIAAGFYV